MSGTTIRSDMATEVLDNLSRSSSGVTRNNVSLSSRVVTWLNRAQQKIARKYDFLRKEVTSATVDGQQRYSFPSDLRSVYSMRLEDGISSKKLTCIMPRDFDRLIPKPDERTEDAPSFYIPNGASGSFELFPIPDAAYVLRLRYSYWPAALSTDSSVSDLNNLDDAIICYATEDGYKWLQEVQDAALWKKRADEIVKDVMSAEQDRYQDWEPISVGFSSDAPGLIGEYYNDPLQWRAP